MIGREENITKLWEDYESGEEYQKNIGINSQIPINIDFYEGRQWANATKDTKDLPRPVVNIVKMIVRNKKASILGSDVKLVFSAERDKNLSDRITAFNNFIEREMGIEELRNRQVDDAVKKGMGIIHFYWDAQASGMQSQYIGGVRGEVIDPLNIFFANPHETDEQKQKWILIVSKIDISAVRNMTQSKSKREQIEIDSDDAKYQDGQEQKGSKLVTVLTRYFRKNGEVYYERATRNVVLHNPIALTPNIKEMANASDMDEVESELPDEAEKGIQTEKAKLYPIVVYCYENREKSIYGLSEIEGIIPNQKSINFNLAMQLLSVQNQAWGKYIVRDKALRGQQINNVPGQVLIDYTPEGNGIRKLAEQPFSQMPLELINILTNLTRTVTGSTEVMTGEQQSANQSGAAIAQLQSQALRPIEELRDRYWRACELGGRILIQFYKMFYEDKPFEYKNNQDEEKQIFNGNDYMGVDFAINIEAGAGTQFSESLSIALLEQLLAADKIDFGTYVDLYPESAMPFKNTLKNQIAEREQSELAQSKIIITQLRQRVMELTEYTKQANNTVRKASSIASNYDAMAQQLDALKVEGATKVLEQNEMIKKLNILNKEYLNDNKLAANIFKVEELQKGTNTLKE